MGPICNSDLKPHPANHQPILSTSQGCWHSTMESSRIRKWPQHVDCLTCYYPHVNCHPQWRWRVSLSLVRYFLNLWKMFSHLLSHVLDPKQASWTFLHPSRPFFRGATRGQPLLKVKQLVGCKVEPTHVIPSVPPPSRDGAGLHLKEQEIEMAPGKAGSLPTSERGWQMTRACPESKTPPPTSFRLTSSHQQRRRSKLWEPTTHHGHLSTDRTTLERKLRIDKMLWKIRVREAVSQ